jgi:hypothetical protein
MLGLSIDASSSSAYSSALNSYITFCTTHNFPLDPTEDTLSFFAVYMSTFIKPSSVNSYLSGICRELEPFFPYVRKNRKSILVSRTLTGCMRRYGTPTIRKDPLSVSDLRRIINSHQTPLSHDDLLFLAQLLTGYTALLRLGEMVFPDNKTLRDFRKVSQRHSVRLYHDHFAFFLPGHKADRFFEGNTIIVQCLSETVDPLPFFSKYLQSRDNYFPCHPHLWLRANGTVPTRSWFLKRLRRFCPQNFAGQSMRAGGATALALAGVQPNIIQAIGRWASSAFQIYIRKNPVILQAFLFRQPSSSHN